MLRFTQQNHAYTLISAAREGKIDRVQKALNNGNNVVNSIVSEGSASALMIAAQKGYLDIIELLLKRGANVNYQDREDKTALIVAVMNNQLAVVHRLLSHKNLDPNMYSKNGWTALYIAANRGFTDIVKLLLNTQLVNLTQVNQDIRNTVGGNVLMVAAMYGYSQIVSELLTARADIKAKDNNKWTALMKAADKGHADVVSVLLKNGAGARGEINATDNSGFTALHLAAKADKKKALEMLLPYAINFIDQQDTTRRTALFYAAQNGHISTVQYLLDNGADQTIPDKAGRTAMTVAKYPNIENALRAAEAEDAKAAARIKKESLIQGAEALQAAAERALEAAAERALEAAAERALEAPAESALETPAESALEVAAPIPSAGQTLSPQLDFNDDQYQQVLDRSLKESDQKNLEEMYVLQQQERLDVQLLLRPVTTHADFQQASEVLHSKEGIEFSDHCIQINSLSTAMDFNFVDFLQLPPMLRKELYNYHTEIAELVKVHPMTLTQFIGIAPINRQKLYKDFNSIIELLKCGDDLNGLLNYSSETLYRLCRPDEANVNDANQLLSSSRGSLFVSSGVSDEDTAPNSMKLGPG